VSGRDTEPELSLSLPLGAGQLTRAFLPDDPPTQEQLAALCRHVQATLREVAGRLSLPGAPERVAGTSKTFKQLARLCGSLAQVEGVPVRRYVTAAGLEALIPKLARLPARKRAELDGVSRPRSRQILAGAVIARAAMTALNVDSVDVCPWGLREGIVLHYLRPLQAARDDSFGLALRPLTESLVSEVAGHSTAPGGHAPARVRNYDARSGARGSGTSDGSSPGLIQSRWPLRSFHSPRVRLGGTPNRCR
jgi:exopolyphosphatase/pppGpp-phosphohydrolase